jgi:hypothetical protein
LRSVRGPAEAFLNDRPAAGPGIAISAAFVGDGQLEYEMADHQHEPRMRRCSEGSKYEARAVCAARHWGDAELSGATADHGAACCQKLGHVPRLEALLIDVLLEAARPFMQLKRE